MIEHLHRVALSFYIVSLKRVDAGSVKGRLLCGELVGYATSLGRLKVEGVGVVCTRP
jgi:hypothetical protein